MDHLKILRRRLASVVLPKEDPTWRFALGARPESRGVVLELTMENGLVGYGYTSDIPHLGYNLETVTGEVRSLSSQVEELDLTRIGPDLAVLQCTGLSNPAFAAVEMAILDLVAQQSGRPLSTHLGGQYRGVVDVLRILSIKDPEKMAQNAQTLVNDGYRYLKIKIDNDPWELDAARIIAVRESVGIDVHLTLDANQSYDAATAIRLYESVRDQCIDVFEQPVGVNDLSGLKRVTQALDSCIVEADESATSVARAWELVSSDSCSGISLKLLRLGGISAALRVADLCRHSGIACRVGAHVGSRLLNSAALHLAAAIPNIDYACELGEYVRLKDDPFTGLEVQDGAVMVSKAPGLGVFPSSAQNIEWEDI